MVTLDDMLKMVEDARDEVIELTQKLVQIPSVNTGVNAEAPWPPTGKPAPGEPYPEPIVPFDGSGTTRTGDELPAAELLRDKLQADGIDSTIYIPGENRGNIVASLGTPGARPKLLMLSHIDVVPVEDVSQWTHDPFGGEIVDGRLWGRGASDMKQIVAAETMALILFKRAGVKLKGELTLAVCSDEESGGAYGFGWMAQHYPEVLRADYSVNEGGGAPIKVGDRLIYPINVGEKGRMEVRIHIVGRGFHASQPWKADNAIYKAEEVIRRIRGYEPEVSVDNAAFTDLKTLAGIDEAVSVDNLEEVLAQVNEVNPSLASYLRAASRMTFVATMINAGVKSNSVAENCTITCDVRSLPHQSPAYVQAQIENLMSGLDGVRVEVINTAVSNASTYDSELADYIMAATKKAIGRDDVEFVPGLTVGFTDSRFVRPLGNVAYGFMPGHPDSDPSKSGAHNINESVDLNSIMSITRYLVALAWDTVVDHD
ncbi:MAG: M20/M25/M40 family metallo-hydrolase [Thermomicrobiales bacterium]|nr:M20/M25/M40 family metallo-hydrolase [Thermomicrobiales bacterium]